MVTFKGVCRIRGTEGGPNMVRVTDGDMTFDDVDEQGYRFAMIQPPLDELPWNDENRRRGNGLCEKLKYSIA